MNNNSSFEIFLSYLYTMVNTRRNKRAASPSPPPPQEEEKAKKKKTTTAKKKKKVTTITKIPQEEVAQEEEDSSSEPTDSDIEALPQAPRRFEKIPRRSGKNSFVMPCVFMP